MSRNDDVLDGIDTGAEKANNINFGTSLQYENTKNQLYRNNLLHRQSFDAFIAPGLDNNMNNPMRRAPEMRNPNSQLPKFHN